VAVEQWKEPWFLAEVVADGWFPTSGGGKSDTWSIVFIWIDEETQKDPTPASTPRNPPKRGKNKKQRPTTPPQPTIKREAPSPSSPEVRKRLQGGVTTRRKAKVEKMDPEVKVEDTDDVRDVSDELPEISDILEGV